MLVNKPKKADGKAPEADETKPDKAIEPAIDGKGPNTELLAVRVPLDLMTVLDKSAKAHNRSIPDWVRFLLMFHLYPDMAKVAVKRFEEDASEIGTLLDMQSRLQMGRAHIGKVKATAADARGRLDAHAKIVEKMDERFSEAERAANAAWFAYLEELAAASASEQADGETQQAEVQS